MSKTLFEVVIPLVHLIRSEVKQSSPQGINFPSFRVLANVNRGLNTVGAIAEHHGVSQPAMTKLVNLLVKKGLIIKKQCDVDKRKTLLSLTKVGLEIYEATLAKAYERIDHRFNELSSKEKKHIVDALLKLKAHL